MLPYFSLIELYLKYDEVQLVVRHSLLLRHRLLYCTQSSLSSPRQLARGRCKRI